MKVSRNSFHYKVYNFARNLWNQGIGIFWILDWIADGHWSNFLVKSYQPGSLCKYFWVIVTLFTLAPVAFLVLLTGVIFALPWFLIAYIGTRIWRKLRPSRGTLHDKGESLIGSFLKAKKQKVCPMIELVD